MAGDEKLKRERAGTYVSADGRFTVQQSSSGWLVLDAEQANELGLPLARGPFGTLDEARAAIAGARSGPAPTSGVGSGQARAGKTAARAGAKPRDQKEQTPRAPRRAPPRIVAPSVVIREIRTADGDELRKLWASVGFRSLGDDDRSLARLARRNPGLVLVAAESGRVVASALGAWDGRRGWIYHVATAESHRRRGIATRLVEQVEAGLRDLGCAKVNVLVRGENDGGREFWAARGYEPGQSRQFGKELEAD